MDRPLRPNLAATSCLSFEVGHARLTRRTLSSLMQFSIRNLLSWTMLAGAAVALFRYTDPLMAAILCVPLVTLYFAIVRLGERQNQDKLALVGAGIGFVVGIFLGVFTDVGLVYLTYRPDLPTTQGFRTLFGSVISAIALAFVGAIIGGVANMILRRKVGHPG